MIILQVTLEAALWACASIMLNRAMGIEYLKKTPLGLCGGDCFFCFFFLVSFILRTSHKR